LRGELVLVGVLVSTLIGWLIGALPEYTSGPGRLQILRALLGAIQLRWAF
jgi:hypothetical protein